MKKPEEGNQWNVSITKSHLAEVLGNSEGLETVT